MATVPSNERADLKTEFELTLDGYEQVVDVENLNDDTLKVARKTKEVLDTVNGVKNYTSLVDLGLNVNNAQLYKIINKMANNSVARFTIEADDVYYPISGLLEVYKIANYTANVRLSGGTNDVYVLYLSTTNWNEIFPEAPMS